MIDYSQLSTQFSIGEQGLALKGSCAIGDDTMLLSQSGAPLLRSVPHWAMHYRLLQGLSRSGADTQVVHRRAPYPAAASVATQDAEIR
jgi:hypothetical protein